jgi:hypothetical protein
MNFQRTKENDELLLMCQRVVEAFRRRHGREEADLGQIDLRYNPSTNPICHWRAVIYLWWEGRWWSCPGNGPLEALTGLCEQIETAPEPFGKIRKNDI